MIFANGGEVWWNGLPPPASPARWIEPRTESDASMNVTAPEIICRRNCCLQRIWSKSKLLAGIEVIADVATNPQPRGSLDLIQAFF